MLACGQADLLGLVVEPEGEDLGVRGDDILAIEDGLAPCLGLQEDRTGIIAFYRVVTVAESSEGGFVQGADVIVGHHGFGIFTIWMGGQYAAMRIFGSRGNSR